MTARARPRRPGSPWGSREHAFAVLGLLGTGALYPIQLRGVVRIRRGGVRLIDLIPRRRRELP